MCWWGDLVSILTIRLQGSSWLGSWKPHGTQPHPPLCVTLDFSPTCSTHSPHCPPPPPPISSDVLDIPSQGLCTHRLSLSLVYSLPSLPPLGWSLLIPLVLSSLSFSLSCPHWTSPSWALRDHPVLLNRAQIGFVAKWLLFVWDFSFETPSPPPSTPLLGIYPEQIITEKDTYTRTFTEAIFTVSKTWK